MNRYRSMDKKELLRRILVLMAGNILIGAGIALFKTSAFGNDPHSAMMLTFAEKTGTTFSICFYVASAVYFVAELIWARDLIWIGTFINWFFAGYFSDFFMAILEKVFPDPLLGVRIGILSVGLLVVSLGISMYQTSDLGVGPYDTLAIILDRKLPWKYFWCRILTDGICALAAILLGSFGTHVGLGTLLSAFGLGPFIAFFTEKVAVKLVGVSSGNAGRN